MCGNCKVCAHELINSRTWVVMYFHSLLCLFRGYSSCLRHTGIYRHSTFSKLGDGPTDLCVIEMDTRTVTGELVIEGMGGVLHNLS